MARPWNLQPIRARIQAAPPTNSLGFHPPGGYSGRFMNTIRMQAVFVAVFLLAAMATGARAQQIQPLQLCLQPDDQSVYRRPLPPAENELYNQGGANLDFNVQYMTDYVFRGIDRSEVGGPEDAANLQFDGHLVLNLGPKVPHPFAGVFVNVYDSDPVSRFQEIRPYFGARLTLQPFILEGGHTAYIFPNRESQDTNEVWGKLTLMDNVFFKLDKPVLSPYILVAYDYDLFNGYYIEAGIRHDFVIEDTGLTLTVDALVSYVRGIELFAGPDGTDSGLQRYQLGLTAKYSLNELLNIPRRYGEWSLKGYLNYTDGLSDKLRTDTQLWGGGGIEFYY